MIAQIDQQNTISGLSQSTPRETLNKILEAHQNFEGFGQTGEFVIAKQQAQEILFLSPLKHANSDQATRLPVDTVFAEPMRLALLGESGTVVGLDYRGETVLAAYEPIATLEVGIVAKVDLQEINAPFIRATVIAGTVAIFLITSGTFLFFRISNPLLALLESQKALRRETSVRQQTEAALDQSEQRFRAIFDGAFQFIGLLTVEGIIIEANQTALEAIAIQRSEVVGQFFWDAPWWSHSPELQQRLKSGIHEAAKGTLVRFEAEHILADGNSVFVDFSLKPVLDEQGNIVMLIPEGRDISDRHQVEVELRETSYSLEFYKQALDQAAILAMTDSRGIISDANDKFCQISKFSREELIGKTHRLVNSGFHPPEFFQELWSTTSQGNIWQGEIKNKTKDGQYYWVDTTIVPFLNIEQEPFQYLAIRFDITERKLAEEKIAEQVALLNVATDAILVRDLANKIQFWSQGAETIYGWSAQEAIGQDITQLLLVDTSSKNEAQQDEALRTVLLESEWQGELSKVSKDGKALIVESRWTLVKDENDAPKAILSVDTDITERRLLEQQFLRTQRLENLGTLASGIAHDLNNVFTPILASSELLSRHLTELDNHSERLLKILESSSRRGGNLIKQILSFARGLDGERHVTQIGHILKEITNIARQTFPKNIQTEMDIPTRTLWTVEADPTQMQQVFMNLVVNARDAMPDGGKLRIVADNQYIDETLAQKYIDAHEGAYVVITIADTGMGMKPEIMDCIFDPFFSTKPEGKGTGLGLSTVFGIVKSHGGFIHVQSEVGQGSEFQVYLPAMNFSDIASDFSNMISSEDLLGNGELVLIVDDEAYVREIIKLTLKAFNYRAIAAVDGIDALAIYAQQQQDIDIVLSDLKMPSLDSSTLFQTLRRINPAVNIILMSGSASATEELQLDESEDTFLLKPFSTESLLLALKSSL